MNGQVAFQIQLENKKVIESKSKKDICHLQCIRFLSLCIEIQCVIEFEIERSVEKFA